MFIKGQTSIASAALLMTGKESMQVKILQPTRVAAF
jgi:hypothetical protein